MPCTLTWECPSGVHRTFRGHVGAAELLASLERVTGDARFDSLRYGIADYLAVQTFEMDTGLLESLAALHFGANRINPNIFSAVVTDRDDVRELVKRFNALEMTTLHVFAREAAPRAWIRLDLDAR